MKIYMFHYVLKNFPYYHFDADLFEEKIKNIKKRNKIISLEEYDKIDLSKDGNKENYVMLTFDDGTIDHYNIVYKILKKYNCPGLFFISSNIFNKEILDIQIIHRLLSLNKFDEMYEILISELQKINFSFDNNDINNSLDNKKTAMFKQLLQYKLPYNVRKNIINKLVKKYNISTNFEDYYINIEQLKEMKQNGMYFGIHTSNHHNLRLLNYNDQFNEINNNLNVLKENNLLENNLLAIAYPYGIYNEDTIKILKELNIKYGFKASITNEESSFEINRIDCNILKEVNYE